MKIQKLKPSKFLMHLTVTPAASRLLSPTVKEFFWKSANSCQNYEWKSSGMFLFSHGTTFV